MRKVHSGSETCSFFPFLFPGGIWWMIFLLLKDLGQGCMSVAKVGHNKGRTSNVQRAYPCTF